MSPQPEYETLPDEYWWINCPCCGLKIIPFTIGRMAKCPICEYAWVSTCVLANVREQPELRQFHLDVLRDMRRTSKASPGRNPGG